jgi:hypothetical protein
LIEKEKKKHGEEGFFFPLPTKQRRFRVFFFNFIFSSKECIVGTLQPKNNVILGFSSIFTVFPNGGGQIIKSW